MRTLPFSMVFFRGGVCAAAVGFSCKIEFLSCWKHGTFNATKVLSISITFLLLPTVYFRSCLTSEACDSNTAIIIFVGRILIPWQSNENWIGKQIFVTINRVQNCATRRNSLFVGVILGGFAVMPFVNVILSHFNLTHHIEPPP